MALAHSPKIVTSGLVMCLDAANPRSYTGSGTTWTDLSGFNRNGTLTNGPTYDGNNKGYFVLDGNNDYISTVTATTLGINSTSTSFTLNTWFKTSGTGEYYLFDNYNGSTDISLRIDSGKFEVFMADSNGTVFNAIQFGSNYNNNVWNNFCLTWDGSNTITAYANGVSLGTSTQAGITGSFDSGAAFLIGSRPTGTSWFPGNISIMMVYNRNLTATEVLQNYNAIRSRFGL